MVEARRIARANEIDVALIPVCFTTGTMMVVA